MKRHSIHQLFLQSDSRFFKFEPVKNVLFDFYLDGFKRRERNKEKLLIIIVKYLILVSFIICIIKFLVGFMPMSLSTKLILFDVPSLVGGIELYNRIVLVLGSFLGLVTHIRLNWGKSGSHKEWTHVFEISRNKVLHGFIKRRSQIDTLSQLVKVIKFFYKMWTIILLIGSKYAQTDIV